MLPEWSNSRWVGVARRQFRNWPSAVAQMLASTETHRAGIRILRALVRLGGWPHPLEVRLRRGGALRTSDAQHLAGLLEAGWRVSLEEGLFLLTGPGEVRLLVRPIDRESRDLCSLYETFVRGDYGERFPDWNVLDIGGGNGDSALCFASRGARRVIAVEPDPRSVAMLRRNLALNPTRDRIEVVEAAATPDGASVDFSIGSPYSAALGTGPDAGASRHVPVPGVAIGQLLDRFERVDLLKVDIEGAEYDLLRAVSPERWTRIRSVRLEFHRGLQDLPTLLEAQGFRVVASVGPPQGLLFAERVS